MKLRWPFMLKRTQDELLKQYAQELQIVQLHAKFAKAHAEAHAKAMDRRFQHLHDMKIVQAPDYAQNRIVLNVRLSIDRNILTPMQNESPQQAKAWVAELLARRVRAEFVGVAQL